MIFLLFLIEIPFIINISPSDYTMKVSDAINLQKKAKALACSFLSKTPILSNKNKERQIKEILKKLKVIEKDSEAKEKMGLFLSAVCYSKIDIDTAQEILIKITEGEKKNIQDDKYSYLFKFEPKTDFQKYKKIMKEVTKIRKEVNEEEESFYEKMTENEMDFYNSSKDIGKKLIKNKNFKEIIKDDYKDENIVSKKKKIKEKNKKEDNTEKVIENEQPKRKNSNDFGNFFEKTDLKIMWGFVISLIIILIFPFFFMQTNYINNNNVDQNNNVDNEEKQFLKKKYEDKEIVANKKGIK